MYEREGRREREREGGRERERERERKLERGQGGKGIVGYNSPSWFMSLGTSAHTIAKWSVTQSQ